MASVPQLRHTKRAFISCLPVLRAVGMAIVLLALAWIFVVNASAHAQKNVNPSSTDQSAYLDYARNLWAHRGVFMEGARGPGYPLTLLVVLDKDLSFNGFFERAKTFTVYLTAAGWLAIWSLLRRHLPRIPALAAWTTIGFLSLVYYAPYVKAEAPFFVTQLVVFLLLGRLLVTPTWQLALLAGVALAVAWLFKSSAIMVLAAFLTAAGAFALLQLVRARQQRLAALSRLVPGLLAPLLVVGAFLVVSSPFLIENHRKFEHSFYNVNSTFYMWYDTWQEAKRGTRAHGDRVGWPQLPLEQLPTAKKYFATHTFEQIRRRVECGLDENQLALTKRRVTQYAQVYLAGLALAVSVHLQRARALLVKHWPVALYALVFFPMHVVLAAWTTPMTLGPRVMASGFPLLVVSCAVAIRELCRPTSIGRLRHINVQTLLSVVVLVMLTFDIRWQLATTLAAGNGGR